MHGGDDAYGHDASCPYTALYSAPPSYYKAVELIGVIHHGQDGDSNASQNACSSQVPHGCTVDCL